MPSSSLQSAKKPAEPPWLEDSKSLTNAVEIAALASEDIDPEKHDYPRHLHGLRNKPLSTPKGLRGSKFGAASEVRAVTDEQRAIIEEDLRKRGKL